VPLTAEQAKAVVNDLIAQGLITYTVATNPDGSVTVSGSVTTGSFTVTCPKSTSSD
jgi:hypothetical protein